MTFALLPSSRVIGCFCKGLLLQCQLIQNHTTPFHNVYIYSPKCKNNSTLHNSSAAVTEKQVLSTYTCNPSLSTSINRTHFSTQERSRLQAHLELRAHLYTCFNDSHTNCFSTNVFTPYNNGETFVQSHEPLDKEGIFHL